MNDRPGHGGYERSVVAIRDASGVVRGTGWFIADDAVLTCWHVLEQAGLRAETVDEVATTVAIDGYQPVGVDARAEVDLALITVTATGPGPGAAPGHSLALAVDVNPTGRRVYSHGYDRTYAIDEFPNGHAMDPGTVAGNPAGHRPADGPTQPLFSIHGVSVDHGQSGAPLWSADHNAVIGVITRSNFDDIAYAIPAQTVVDAWPRFEDALSVGFEPEADATGPDEISGVTCIDLPRRIRPPGRDRDGLVGRDQAVDDLVRRLSGDADDAVVALVTATTATEAFTLHGQGGIGKSSLANECCHRLTALSEPSRRPRLIWWINGENETSINDSYRRLLERLGLEVDERRLKADAEIQLALVGSWIAVFDNAPDPDTFDQWRPQATGGRIMVTSRYNTGWNETFPVDLIGDIDAEAWLREAALAGSEPAVPAGPEDSDGTEPGHNTPHRSERRLPPDDEDALAQLVEQLGGLALALSLAASQLKQGTSIRGYLDLYLRDSFRPLVTDDEIAEGYDRTIYTSLAVGRDLLRESHGDGALRMLELASFLAPDFIPVDLFTPESLGVDDELGIHQAKRLLARLSLIQLNGTTHFSVHRLVQAVTRETLKHPIPAESGSGLAATPPTEGGETHTRSGAETPLIGPLDLVVFGANSITAPLRLGTEMRDIKISIGASRLRDGIRCTLSPGTRVEDLVQHVVDYQPQIVHFSGHGSLEGIHLLDDNGGSHPVTGSALAGLFKDRGVRLVVLNCCYSESQAQPLAEVVGAVVATPVTIADGAAVAFSKRFYRSLGDGATIGRAVDDSQALLGLYHYTDTMVTMGDVDQTFSPTDA